MQLDSPGGRVRLSFWHIGIRTFSQPYFVSLLVTDRLSRLSSGGGLCHGCCAGSGESVAGVKRDYPHQIRANRRHHKGHLQYVENREKQERIGQKAAADNKLGVSANVQQRVPTSRVGLRMPDAQVLFRTSDQSPPLKPNDDEAKNSPENK